MRLLESRDFREDASTSSPLWKSNSSASVDEGDLDFCDILTALDFGMAIFSIPAQSIWAITSVVPPRVFDNDRDASEFSRKEIDVVV